MNGKKIEIGDFAVYKYPTNLALSPDGAYAAFAVVEPNIENNCYDSCIWLCNTETKGIRQLTSGKRERSFAWLDGETILFIGNREGEKEAEETFLYKISVNGGEAELFADLPKNVSKIAYQNGAVYAIVRESYYEKEKDYEVFDEIPFWNNGSKITNKVRQRVYRYDLASKEFAALSPEYGETGDLWVENGTVFFTCNVFTDKKQRHNGLYEYRESDGVVELLVPQGEFSISYACCRAGRVDFFGARADSLGNILNPELYTLENGEVRLQAHYDNTIGTAVSSDGFLAGGKTALCRGGRIYAAGVVGSDVVIRSFDMDGVFRDETKESGSALMLDLKEDEIWFVGMRNQGLPEIYRLADGDEEKVSAFNDAVLSECAVAPVEHFRYTYKGTELDGFVIRPADYSPGQKYPGILTIHGGPKGAYGALFSHEFQVYAANGYFVFYTNPIGSDGRGNEFADIAAKQGSIDYEELMFFTDEVIRRNPDLDGERLGVMGISYGGFMSNWIIGHTNRFKAAVPQCGISNWITKTNTTDIGYSFNSAQLGGDAWTNYEKQWELSPLKYADKVKTPALFVHCDEDYRCYITEALQMFTALKYHGVPAKLFLIHGEHHGVSKNGKPKRRVRRLREILGWMDKWLKE